MNIRLGRGMMMSRKHSIPRNRSASQVIFLAVGMLVPTPDTGAAWLKPGAHNQCLSTYPPSP